MLTDCCESVSNPTPACDLAVTPRVADLRATDSVTTRCYESAVFLSMVTSALHQLSNSLLVFDLALTSAVDLATYVAPDVALTYRTQFALTPELDLDLRLKP